jgi:uncharacterized coiled-coil DUF342 family protein
MAWLQKVLRRLFPKTRAQAERHMQDADRTLAELRAKVRALPPEQRAAFAKQIQALVDEQAQAHNDLSDLLDDRRDR